MMMALTWAGVSRLALVSGIGHGGDRQGENDDSTIRLFTVVVMMLMMVGAIVILMIVLVMVIFVEGPK